MLRMDTKEIRRDNLRRLIAGAGSVKKLADKAGTNPDWLSALASDNPPKTPSGTVRGIGPELARSLEKAADKPQGWLDVPHLYSEKQKMWIDKFLNLSDDTQKKAIEYLEMLEKLETAEKQTKKEANQHQPVNK